ncbi:amino acid ABC transporter ATP-binding protein [Campylobacter troglodytis]|uniref:amino acid ABC transporter ATP-binding protein n=1 Tax=Campylobacter troglodytis TaxID=654363 RepID=UPI00115A8021|nr:amino acid ABC transporter ATP-binding protein [Campylobacter troglodytis]TQR59037.1 amino acid ABC transporter ATP-binding protein [Campylobacter troglodytis]
MLKLSNLNKSFDKKLILKDISFNANDNEIIAIIGPSGAGKSTLLRSINLLEIPQSGQIIIDELKLDYAKFSHKEALKLRQKSAMVFQHYNLFINKNALENIAEALIVVKKMSKNEAFELAFEHLSRVGLKDKASSYAFELSGGQAQRVGIARALALNPSIMLFDEPTSALDPELVGEVLEVIKNIQGKTMLLVTHELNFARAVANRIIFMDQGQIIEENEASEFFNNPKHNRVKLFLEKLSGF